jgi:uncharacterized protein (DUF433 family)
VTDARLLVYATQGMDTTRNAAFQDLYELPAYGVPEAARYLRTPYQTLRYWLTGFGHMPPIIQMAAPNRLSYLNLLECHMVMAMREVHHLRLPKVRRALASLDKLFPSKHPFLDTVLETNGVDVLTDNLGKKVNLSRNGQLEMTNFLTLHLQRIEVKPDGVFRFFPFVMIRSSTEPKYIAIEPTVGFGKPVIAGTGISTATIAARFNARESVDELAEEYGRTKREIEEAIRWEQGLPIAA